MTGRIILIGMPAGGKTTIGAALSRALSVPLYDADALTEQTAGRSIPAIFAAEGEAAFRALERRTLEALCTETEIPCVIATGGGAVLTEQNRELLRRSGTVFWLDRTVDNLCRLITPPDVRCSPGERRPCGPCMPSAARCTRPAPIIGCLTALLTK